MAAKRHYHQVQRQNKCSDNLMVRPAKLAREILSRAITAKSFPTYDVNVAGDWVVCVDISRACRLSVRRIQISEHKLPALPSSTFDGRVVPSACKTCE